MGEVKGQKVQVDLGQQKEGTATAVCSYVI